MPKLPPNDLYILVFDDYRSARITMSFQRRGAMWIAWVSNKTIKRDYERWPQFIRRVEKQSDYSAIGDTPREAATLLARIAKAKLYRYDVGKKSPVSEKETM